MTNSDLPGDLTGNDPLVAWLNRLKMAVKRRTTLPGTGYRMRQTESGCIFEIQPGSGGAGASFPFIVYKSAQDTLKAKLTPGYIVTTGEPFQPTNMAGELTLAVNSIYWFYLNITSATEATIVASKTMPAWSVNKIMIAKVVTTTTAAPLTILQILRENPQIPCV